MYTNDALNTEFRNSIYLVPRMYLIRKNHYLVNVTFPNRGHACNHHTKTKILYVRVITKSRVLNCASVECMRLLIAGCI